MACGYTLQQRAPAQQRRGCHFLPQCNEARVIGAKPLVRPQPVQVSGLSPCEAEDLLDWLEANGITARKLHFDPARGFTVIYEPLPAERT